MRIVHLPEKNVQLADPLTDNPGDFIPFKRWFLTCILNDQRMGGSHLQMACIIRLVEKTRAAHPGGELRMEDEEYDACKPVVEAPTINVFPNTPWQPLLMAQLEPYRRAFMDAQYVNDAKAKAEAKKK